MSLHSPEPWILFEVGDRFKHQGLATSDQTSILTTTIEGGVTWAAVYNDEDARRIAACVNACKGFTTEQLNDITAMGGMVIATSKICRLQNTINELVAAMEDLMGSDHPVTPVAYFRADELVSKIKAGGAA